MRLAVTGAVGFIGSAFCRHVLVNSKIQVYGIDKLTYAANPMTVAELSALPGFMLRQADIADPRTLRPILNEAEPDAIVHIAAETHVDRSIDETAPFITTNLNGTYHLLEAALDYYRGLPPAKQKKFLFLHVSTDEVYGSLGQTGAFSESSPYAPNSPYAASKAGGEHIVRAWAHTYGLPAIITNCSNNYGPYQFPEKLIPNMIIKALHGEILPIYGQGNNIRDWLYVDDHAAALWLILQNGKPNEKYHIGGQQEIDNKSLVESLCDMLDVRVPNSPYRPHRSLIRYVVDRPGHDFRYAMNIEKISQELGWKPTTALAEGLAQTVDWYLTHRDWWQQSRTGYTGERLGLGKAAHK